MALKFPLTTKTFKTHPIELGIVAHDLSYLSYFEGWGRRITSLRPAWATKQDLILKTKQTSN
jgi:hypothetical protein